MMEREQAADHLRVIRSLMERATVYRALSWPTALFGGTLAVVLAVLLFFREQAAAGGGAVGETVQAPSSVGWVACWLVALVVTGAFNGVLIGRKSQREGRPFFSAGLKIALRNVVPPMLAGGVLGITMALSKSPAVGAALWVLCYGLALLATTGIAPASIPRLGWVFLIAGLGAFLFVWPGSEEAVARVGPPMLAANLIMGSCFGGLHLIYGLIVRRAARPSKAGDAEPGPA